MLSMRNVAEELAAWPAFGRRSKVTGAPARASIPPK
jgi:hypothetical protein